MIDTNTQEYADYLVNHQKRFISKIVQLPYRLHLKSLNLCETLDIGCGAGRNLKAFPKGKSAWITTPVWCGPVVMQGSPR